MARSVGPSASLSHSALRALSQEAHGASRPLPGPHRLGGEAEAGSRGPGCRWAKAQPPVVSWGVVCDAAALVSTAAWRGHTCPEWVLRVLITGRNVVFAFFSFRLCERGWVFTRRGAAGSHGTEVRWSRVRGQVVAAQRGSRFPPVLAAWPSSWPPPALFLPCTSERVSGVLRLQRTLAPQGASWQKWPQACPGRGEGAAQAPAVPWAGRRDGTAVSAPHPSKPQLPGFDSGPAGSGVMRPSTCGHRLRGQRGQSRTTGCLRSAEGPEGPALSGGVLWAPGLRSMACQHQLYRPKGERRPPSPRGALLGAHSALPRGSPVRVPARSADSGGAVAFADVPSGRWV